MKWTRHRWTDIEDLTQMRNSWCWTHRYGRTAWQTLVAEGVETVGNGEVSSNEVSSNGVLLHSMGIANKTKELHISKIVKIDSFDGMCVCVCVCVR